MLKSLYIRNFVLIEQLQVNFNDGFSSFIGETGAGKSILIDAIGLVCGERASGNVVFKNEAKALIEAEFDISTNQYVIDILDKWGLECEEDILILTREITSEGKSSARVNHRSVNIGVLKELGDKLVDIHSQFDTLNLHNRSAYLGLLNRFVAKRSLLEDYQATYKAYKDALDEFEEFKKAKLNVDDLDMLYFNLQEIENATFRSGECEELEEKAKTMGAFAKIQAKGQEIIELLKGDDGALSKLYLASKAVSSLNNLETFKDFQNRFDDIYYNLDDIYQQFVESVQTSENDEVELNRIEERLFKLNRLLRKYNTNEEGIIKLVDLIKVQISQIENRQDYIDKQAKHIEDLRSIALQKAQNLQQIRQIKAQELEAGVLSQLKDLALSDANFKICFDTVPLNAMGIDEVSFMITMNKGEELRPLEKSASGGELSRFNLGMKVIFASLEAPSTLIFDEIDSGISGATAFAIGHKMQQISQKVQVFAVTHLAQVAAASEHLYFINKEVKNDKTISSINEVVEKERYEKLALIGFGDINEKSLAATIELCKQAKNE